MEFMTLDVKRYPILIVDDEQDNLDAFRFNFRKTFDILTATSGPEALAILAEKDVAVIVTDQRMPKMTGVELLREVRNKTPETVGIILTAFTDVDVLIEAINLGQVYRYITKPWDDNDIVLLVRHALERKSLEADKRRLEALAARQNEELKALNTSLEQRVAARTADLGAANDALLQANANLKTGYVTTLKVFSSLIEMRGVQLAGHSRRVADLTQRLAFKLGLDGKQAQEVFVAALLHEIGKLGFPDELLATPVASMNSKQTAEYRQHVVRGEQLLMPLPDLHAAAACVGAQLERFDGTGFPKQLFEQAIPQGARILAVASDYDNLQLGVLAQRRLNDQEARVAVQRGSATRYDPLVVDALMDILGAAVTREPEPVLAGEAPLSARALLPGMVLARDLIAPSGLLVLSTGHKLDAHMIEKLVDFQRSNNVELRAHVVRTPTEGT